MKKIFLDNLPQKSNNRIDWEKSIGYKVKFIFDEVHGEILIKNYIRYGKHPKLLIQYLDKIKEIDIGVFKKCRIQKLIGKPLSNFLYNISDEINSLKIIDRSYKDTVKSKDGKQYNSKLKIYKCKCNVCDKNHIKEERQLKIGIGCPYCNGKKVAIGVNDIATTRPDLVKYFKFKEDSNKYTKFSDKKVFIVCPLCGSEKYMSLKDLSTNGISCICIDGFSYPEKFIFNLLTQINIKFETQYMPKWSNKKRFDFFIVDYNLILEVHGEQHFHHSFKGCGGDSLETVKANDLYKKQLALKNNVNKYIELDCSKSNINFIKQSVLKSELSKFFDFENINWKQCNEYATKNVVYQICDLWNKYKTTTKIKEELHMSRTTIIKYLKLGAESNLCDYNAKENRDKGLIIGRKSKNKLIRMEG